MTPFHPVPYIPRRNTHPNLINGPTDYPIGMSPENLMYYWRNAASLRADIFFFVSVQPNGFSSLGVTDINQAIDLSEDFAQNHIFYASVGGSSVRRTTENTRVKADFTIKDNLYCIPTQDAPKHLVGDINGSFLIDFNDVLFYNGLYYPKIVINLVYAHSNGAGEPIGYVNFGDLGTIQIYYPNGGTPLGAPDFPIAGGTVQIGALFSSLIGKDGTNYTTDDTITLKSESDLNLSDYIFAFFGPDQIPITEATESKLVFNAPQTKFQGHIKLVAPERYDCFFTAETFRIS